LGATEGVALPGVLLVALPTAAPGGRIPPTCRTIADKKPATSGGRRLDAGNHEDQTGERNSAGASFFASSIPVNSKPDCPVKIKRFQPVLSAAAPRRALTLRPSATLSERKARRNRITSRASAAATHVVGTPAGFAPECSMSSAS